MRAGRPGPASFNYTTRVVLHFTLVFIICGKLEKHNKERRTKPNIRAAELRTTHTTLRYTPSGYRRFLPFPPYRFLRLAGCSYRRVGAMRTCTRPRQRAGREYARRGSQSHRRGGNMPGGEANHIAGEGVCPEGKPITSQGREYARRGSQSHRRGGNIGACRAYCREENYPALTGGWS
eukprot:680118-Prorocentrum_minimum.AAC.1